jgi:hypothetical protein
LFILVLYLAWCVHKSWRVSINFMMSVHPSICPHATARLLLDGFSWNVIFEYFLKCCWENSGFIKIRQEYRVLYMKTSRHFLSHLAHCFWEWEMFHTKVVEEIETHFMLSNFFFKLCHLCDNVEKWYREGQVTDDNTLLAYCTMDTYDYKCTHSGCVILAYPLQQ